MTRYLIDTHTHTVASGHAYNTIDEMSRYAAAQGLAALGITEHAPKMPGSCQLFYFTNLKSVPRQKFGIRRYMGCEANITDYAGKLDLPGKVLAQMDIVIASFHLPCIKPGGIQENTQALLGVMDNPAVHIIGHPDDQRYPVDMEQVVLAAKKKKKLLELNNASLKPTGPREGARENDLKMLALCKKHEVCIALGSDAHVEEDIANFSLCEELLKEVDFPDRLIANLDLELMGFFLAPIETLPLR